MRKQIWTSVALCTQVCGSPTQYRPINYFIPVISVPDPQCVIQKAYLKLIMSVQISSVAQSCPTLCDPMNHSTPGLPVHHQLPEFTQTHRVSDAIQPSHPLVSPSPPAPNPSQQQSLFQWVNSSHELAKVLELALASFLPKKSQGWSLGRQGRELWNIMETSHKNVPSDIHTFFPLKWQNVHWLLYLQQSKWFLE